MDLEEKSPNYPPPKTVKMFFSAVEKAFQKRDGDRIYKELKELYLTNHYSNIPAKNWEIKVVPEAYSDNSRESSTYANLMESVRIFAYDRAKGNWT